MSKHKMPLRKKLLIAGAVVLAVLILLMGAFFWYVSDYYRAEDVALAVLSGENGITVQDDLTILSPSAPTDTAIIFYPGAKVGGAGLSAAAGPDPPDRRYLHSGGNAL